MWVGAIGQAIPPLFVIFSPVRSLHRMPASTREGLAVADIAAASAATTVSPVGQAVDEAPHPTSANAPLARADEGDATAP
jgi:hypothetical protein